MVRCWPCCANTASPQAIQSDLGGFDAFKTDFIQVVDRAEVARRFQAARG
jgi:hypothetical protein